MEQPLGNPAAIMAASKGAEAVSKADKWGQRILLGGVGAGVLYALYKISNIISTPADLVRDGVAALKDDDAKDEVNNFEQSNNANAFDPNWYRNLPRHANYTEAAADIWASRIHDAKGTLNDDEDAVYNAIDRARTKAHVAKIAYRFSVLHKSNMYQYLKSFLSNSEMAIVTQKVRKKPNYSTQMLSGLGSAQDEIMDQSSTSNPLMALNQPDNKSHNPRNDF